MDSSETAEGISSQVVMVENAGGIGKASWSLQLEILGAPADNSNYVAVARAR
jgi:hypothetical protein